MQTLLWLLCVGLAGSPAQDGAGSTPDGTNELEPEAPLSIPFTLTSQNNIAVEALFNETDSVALMFHTAADAIFLTREAVQGMRSLTFDGTASLQSWGGEAEVRHSTGNALRIGELTWADLSITEAERSGPGTGGKFGPDLFGSKIIEIDFEQSVLLIHEKLPEYAEQFDWLAVEHRRDGLFVRGSVQVGERWLGHDFLIHTGFGGTFLFDNAFAEANHLDAAFQVVEGRELKDSLGNIVKTRKGVVPAFRLGHTELASVPAELFPGEIGGARTSVVGGDVLKRFHLILDSAAGVLYLRPNALFEAAYSQ